MFDLELVTEPVAKPVEVPTAKAHCKVDSSDFDILFAAYIAAATSHLDGPTGVLKRCLVEQTWKLHLPAFPCGVIQLPLPPLISVTALTYVDGDGVVQTLATDQYTVLTGARAQVAPAFNTSWPTTRCQPRAVTITFKAGYGAAGSVPAPLIAAILLMVDDLFHDPTAGVHLSSTVMALIGPYRILKT